MESTSEVEKHIPSFFHNSFPGNSVEEMRSEEQTAATSVVGECKRKTVVGGFTCCVPGCVSNSVRDTGLSFILSLMAEIRKSKTCEDDGFL